MVKITLISLLLYFKFTVDILSSIFSTEFIGNDTFYISTFAKKSPITIKQRNPFNIISKGDILLSEILFNPKLGGVDFVEIYNNSNHEIDLKELQLANANAAGEPASIKNVSSSKLMIAPGSYWVITTNQANIKLNYQTKFPNQFVQISSLPAFNNDKGVVILLSNNQVLDRLDYNSKTHHPLIQDDDGISLERVSFNASANEAGNFKSAAATSGFATPTYKNSQELTGDENFARLISKTFSPDGDNFEDLMILEYQLAANASLATVNIYNDKGKLVKQLLKNQTIGTNGNLTWDGVGENGQKAAVGIYVILFEFFDLKGNTKRIKSTCVLAGKRN